MNRREFIILSAATAAGCGGGGGPAATTAVASTSVDAGPASDYSTDGVYDRFRGQGFFIVRRVAELVALSSYCTHRHCKLETEEDHSFYCKCHGSCFDPEGKVTEGPAERDLPRFPSVVAADGHLIVTVPR